MNRNVESIIVKKSFLLPLFLFSGTWVAGLLCSILNIYDFSFVDNQFTFLLFSTSLISFIFPIFIVSVGLGGFSRFETTVIVIDRVKCKGYLFNLSLIVFGILTLNYIKYGYPPFFAFFGFSTLNYVEYGSLKQLLFSILGVQILVSVISRNYKYFIFPIFIYLLYVARGPLLTSLAGLLIMLLIIKRVKISTVITVFFLFMFINAIIGEYRTGKELFYEYLRIRKEYYGWNMAFLWFVSYVAIPFSNMLWIIKDELIVGFGQSLVGFLPGSLQLSMFDFSVYPDRVIDNAHGYLAPIFNDFGWLGVIAFNMLISILFCWILKRGSLLSFSFCCGILCFTFFFNFFIQLTSVISLVIIYLFSSAIQEKKIQLISRGVF